MIAVLFARRNSIHKKLGCDVYDIGRDATTWPGGSPCIAHPPSRSWGLLSHMAKPRPGERELALWAIAQVRKNGGVLEHPIYSRLWSEAACCDWGIRDDFGGVLIPVFQSWWGHKAPKKTGLYFVGHLPELPEYQPPRMVQSVESMSQACREKTPFGLAAWLVDYASRCEVPA
jgi:hypothetical protein